MERNENRMFSKDPAASASPVTLLNTGQCLEWREDAASKAA